MDPDPNFIPPEINQAESARPDGSVGWGCLLGMLIQIVFVAAPLVIAALGSGRVEVFFENAAVLFGLTQWLAIIPLIARRRVGKRTVIGLLITAGLGFLFSAACGALVLQR